MTCLPLTKCQSSFPVSGLGICCDPHLLGGKFSNTRKPGSKGSVDTETAGRGAVPATYCLCLRSWDIKSSLSSPGSVHLFWGTGWMGFVCSCLLVK